MPYKDPEHKREWERQHRAQRIARRRELRRFDASQASPPVISGVQSGSIDLPWLPLAAGVGLAAYTPPLAIAAGSLMLFAAASYKKDWTWWFVSLITIVLALFFLWWGRKEKE